MIASVPFTGQSLTLYRLYVLLFFLFLFVPLAVVVVFSFHDSLYPSLPWQGFSWDWYTGDSRPRLGLLNDRRIISSLGNSFIVACGVTLLSVALAVTNALLFVRHQFRFKSLSYMLLMLPLVIPGVILGVSILVASSQIANGLEEWLNMDIEWLRPGLILVVLGQVAFITSITSLVMIARYQRFDPSLEEAALNLGASPMIAFWTVTLPFLRSTMISCAIVAFLMSFENFNTTLMLVGSDAPLTIEMYQRIREGSTPVLNAVSVLLMVISAVLASLFALFKRD